MPKAYLSDIIFKILNILGYKIAVSIYFLVPKQRKLYSTCNFFLRVLSGTRSTFQARHRSRLDIAPSEFTHIPLPLNAHSLGQLSVAIPKKSISECNKKKRQQMFNKHLLNAKCHTR